MLKIETGLETRALKVVIYGAEGIGKSTFAEYSNAWEQAI